MGFVFVGFMGLVTACGVPDSAHPAASVVVPGSVRDRNGEPLVATSVYVDDAGVGTTYVTDASGNFSFPATVGDEVRIRVDGLTQAYGRNGFMDPFTVTPTSTAHFIDGFFTTLPPTGIGTEGADVLTGTPGPDVLLGLGGDDVIVGLAGDDVLIGGAGDDQIKGRAGNDQLSGGDGDDELDGDGGDDYIRGWDGDDTQMGGPGADSLLGELGQDTLNGGGGRDSLEDNVGNEALPDEYNLLIGGPGRDEISLSGSSGMINAGPGDDTVHVAYIPDLDLHVDCGEDDNDTATRNTSASNIPNSDFEDCELIYDLV
jgi:Ca2+-binding RTX toxin-like protein